MQLNARQFLRRSQVIIASLMLGLVLLLNAMAASPSLHELLHADAGQSGHQCAVTMYMHGQMDSATVDVPVEAHQPLFQTISFAYNSVFCPAIQNLPAGRAPPVGSSNS